MEDLTPALLALAREVLERDRAKDREALALTQSAVLADIPVVSVVPEAARPVAVQLSLAAGGYAGVPVVGRFPSVAAAQAEVLVRETIKWQRPEGYDGWTGVGRLGVWLIEPMPVFVTAQRTPRRRRAREAEAVAT